MQLVREDGSREKYGRCRDPDPGPLHVLIEQQRAWVAAVPLGMSSQ